MSKRSQTSKLSRALRYRGHQRLAELVQQSGHPWWDWGHRVMALTGSDFGGNWTSPQMSTWWYRESGFNYRRGTQRWAYEVVKDYETFRERTAGIDPDSDEHYPWRAIAQNQDGEVVLGRRYWGGQFYGLSRPEVRIVRRWLLEWWVRDWFGLRSVLYGKALHAAVHQRRPFSCQIVPDKGSGGYDHWHCQLPRRHSGPHRFNNYTWHGPQSQVVFDEQET